MVEATFDDLPRLARSIRHPASVTAQVDISRVASIESFGPEAVLRGRTIDDLWTQGPQHEHGKLFIIWLAPFRDMGARQSVVDTLERMAGENRLAPTYPALRIADPNAEADGEPRFLPIISPQQTSLARAIRGYRNSGAARAVIQVQTKRDFATLIASGASHRIDPVKPLQVNAPGDGAEPPPPAPRDLAAAPVVVVVDGGRSASSYAAAEAWRAPVFVSNAVADHKHGNRVTSLIVQAYAWNNNLPLPEISCRVGTVQAVPKKGAKCPWNPEQLIAHLDAIATVHPDAKVWNISANEPEAIDPQVVSYLGHALSILARKHGILPVVSTGNVSNSNQDWLCPPANCEAALVVGGRKFTAEGKLGAACPVCLPGPGPDGMLKPDLSWFSRLRMIGGVIDTGSSYPTCLVSTLAAHTFASLKEPTPDLVRALLINEADLGAYDPKLGWGTPYNGHLPWSCPPGTVILLWRASLKPGINYYWNDIPIPPQLVRDGRLRGRAALTAILNPITGGHGESNYFATRLQVALQYTLSNGKAGSLLGSMKEDRMAEQEARKELAKWHSVRRLNRDFSKRGIGFSGNTMRLFARVYARDLYQFNMLGNADLDAQDAVFVLSFADGSNSSALYNAVTAALGSYVESAVIDQEIEIGV